MELPGKRFNENAKMRIPRGSADLKFLLGKSAIRAPGRRTRNGPFRISTTHSNVLSISKSAQKSERNLKSLKYWENLLHITCRGIRLDDLPGDIPVVDFFLAAPNHPLKGPAGTIDFRWL